jgi:H+/Cl- antiporter ClcA
MKRADVLLLTVFLASLLGYAVLLADQLPTEELRRPQPTTLALALSLILGAALPGSILSWRWASGGPRRRLPRNKRRVLAVAANAALSLPLLMTGSYLLLSASLPDEVTLSNLWILSLAVAWVLLPFATAVLVAAGQAAGRRIYPRG